MTDVSLSGKTIFTNFIHTPKLGEIECVKDGLLVLGNDGLIDKVVKPQDLDYESSLDAAQTSNTLVEFGSNQYLLPGFVDLHIHAPQWPQLGSALDVPLEVWLQEHTFPLEAKYQDARFAQEVYTDLVSSLLANGTTTAVYFATIHAEATRVLAETCRLKGQRAFVGKVVMDDKGQCPDFYRDKDTETALVETAEFIDFVERQNGVDGLVQPIITPRFIPSCTDKALQRLGDLAEKTKCHVQTHCSESDWEHGYVLERMGKSDAEALRDFGLLTRHTVLAHSNFLSEDDMDVVREAGAGVAHCPLSNYFFSNAVFPLRRALEKGLRVGLGTDISGGPSASLLEGSRHAIFASRNLEEGVRPDLERSERRTEQSRIDFRQALYVATAGGADVLDLKVGKFEPGHHFDAILIDPHISASPIYKDFGLYNLEAVAEKIIMLATRANITKTFVGGILVSTQ